MESQRWSNIPTHRLSYFHDNASRSLQRQSHRHYNAAQRVKAGLRPDVIGGACFTGDAYERHEAKTYDEKLDPQPQLFVEFGLIKLNPCRIKVSS